MFAKARQFLAEDSGATAIEYCLIAAGLSIVIVTAVNGIGTTLNSTFKSVSTAFEVAHAGLSVSAKVGFAKFNSDHYAVRFHVAHWSRLTNSRRIGLGLGQLGREWPKAEIGMAGRVGRV